MMSTPIATSALFHFTFIMCCLMCVNMCFYTMLHLLNVFPHVCLRCTNLLAFFAGERFAFQLQSSVPSERRRSSINYLDLDLDHNLKTLNSGPWTIMTLPWPLQWAWSSLYWLQTWPWPWPQCIILTYLIRLERLPSRTKPIGSTGIVTNR